MSASNRTRPRSRRPQVETLEDRCVPSTANYVEGVYTTLLHRPPGPAELSSWVNVLDAGVAPAQFVQTVSTSPEFQAAVITDDYTRFLHRTPGAQEIAGWQNFLNAGNSEDTMAGAFLSSAEYLQQHSTTPSVWLNSVYNDVLGRPVDQSGLNTWSPMLDVRLAATFDRVAVAIVQSQEARGREVALAYQDLLGRPPDATGQAAWMAALNQNPNPEQVLAQIEASQEFINLASNTPLPPTSSGPGVTITPPVFIGATTPSAPNR
jgi:hypothetical protein